MPQSTVVITGLGVVSSIGIGADAFFEAYLAKKTGIRSLADRTDEGAKPGSVTEPAGLWIGGPIVDFDPKLFVRPRKALKVMCREIQTVFAASQMAIEASGLAPMMPGGDDASDSVAAADRMDPASVGTVFGSEMFYGPPSEMEDAMRECIDEHRNFDASAFGAAAMKQVMPLWMLKYLPNMPACHVGIALGAQGPNNTLVLGDVSGPAAMIEAESCLQRGIATVMIAGGVGTRINTTRMNYRGDLPIGDVHDPLHWSSRPHDPTSRGVIGGEAAAAIVLEQAAHAAGRNATVLARIVSHASRFVPSTGMDRSVRCSANDQGPIRGSTAAIISAIEGALDSAELSSDDISLVVSHAMGDPIIDRAERDAIDATLPGVPITAPIAALGHCGAASGTIGIVTGAMIIAKKKMLPTIGSGSGDGHPLSNSPTDWPGGYVMCLSHTSEGNAIAIILGNA